MKNLRSHRGYIALISVLVISFMLTTLAMLAAENGLRARMNTTDLNNRIAAIHYARSCESLALLRLAQESSYRPEPGGEAAWLTGTDSCRIENLSENDGQVSVETSGTSGNSIGKVRIDARFASTSEVQIMEWLEL